MSTLSNGERQFAWPLKTHLITAGWYYSDGSKHRALDFRAAEGTPVYAAESGTVTIARRWSGKVTTGDTNSYGNLVRIQHDNYNGGTLETLYAHLSSFSVSVGDKVTEGQFIGYSGNTGNSFGAHLHFEVRYKGNRTNPLNWLDGDFTTASSAVKLGTYSSVKAPEPAAPAATSSAAKLQTITVGPVSLGDASAIYALCKERGLTDAGLYKSAWVEG